MWACFAYTATVTIKIKINKENLLLQETYYAINCMRVLITALHTSLQCAMLLNLLLLLIRFVLNYTITISDF